jgi:hypothetical protein
MPVEALRAHKLAVELLTARVHGVPVDLDDVLDGFDPARVLTAMTNGVAVILSKIPEAADLALNTAGGISNRKALVSAAEVAVAMGVAQVNSGGSISSANCIVQEQVDAFVKATGATGHAKDAIENYIDAIDKIPKTATTSIDINTSGALASLQHVLTQEAQVSQGVTSSWKLSHYAGGGPFDANTIGVVGENGPELVAFGASGYVTPTDMLRPAALGSPGDFGSYGGGSGGGNTYITVPVTVQGPMLGTTQAVQQAVMTAMGQLGLRSSTSYTPAQSGRNRSS